MSSRRFSQGEEREVCTLYEAGWTLQRVAEKYGAASLTVAKALRRNDVEVRPRRQLRDIEPDEKQRIVAAYEGGSTIAELAKRHRVGVPRIREAIKAAGVRVGRYGVRSGSWRGGRSISGEGYVLVRRTPDDVLTPLGPKTRYVLEHRLVMARLLGRPLKSNETVHHKNGRRDDNRPENLELRVGNHGQGATEKHCDSCTCFFP